MNGKSCLKKIGTGCFSIVFFTAVGLFVAFRKESNFTRNLVSEHMAPAFANVAKATFLEQNSEYVQKLQTETESIKSRIAKGEFKLLNLMLMSGMALSEDLHADSNAIILLSRVKKAIVENPAIPESEKKAKTLILDMSFLRTVKLGASDEMKSFLEALVMTPMSTPKKVSNQDSDKKDPPAAPGNTILNLVRNNEVFAKANSEVILKTFEKAEKDNSPDLEKEVLELYKSDPDYFARKLYESLSERLNLLTQEFKKEEHRRKIVISGQ